MKILIIIVVLFSNISVFSQTLKLQNFEKETKFKNLGTTDYLEIKLRETNNNLNINNTYYGLFSNKNGNKYEFDIDYENIVEESSNYSNIVYTTKEYFDTSIIRSFTKEEIEFIVHHKRSESFFNNLFTISLFGAAFSPLLCMDYKSLQYYNYKYDYNNPNNPDNEKKELFDKVINMDNYLRLAGGFLVTAALSYTISITLGKKKYYIDPNSFEEANKIWKLE